LREVGVGVAGFGVGFLPGSIFTLCAATRSGHVVNAPNPIPINSNAQAVKTVVFIIFVAPPTDDVDLENERLVASLLRGNGRDVVQHSGAPHTQTRIVQIKFDLAGWIAFERLH